MRERKRRKETTRTMRESRKMEGGRVDDKFLKIKKLEEYLKEDEAREYRLKRKEKEEDDDEDEKKMMR